MDSIHAMRVCADKHNRRTARQFTADMKCVCSERATHARYLAQAANWRRFVSNPDTRDLGLREARAALDTAHRMGVYGLMGRALP